MNTIALTITILLMTSLCHRNKHLLLRKVLLIVGSISTFFWPVFQDTPPTVGLHALKQNCLNWD